MRYEGMNCAAGGAVSGDACRGKICLLKCESVGFEDENFVAFIRPVGGGEIILLDLPLYDDDGQAHDETCRKIAALCGAMGVTDVEWNYEMEGIPFLGYIRDRKLIDVFSKKEASRCDYDFALGQIVTSRSGERRMVVKRQISEKGRNLYMTEVLDPVPGAPPYRTTFGDALVAAEA